jgi:hypothetical protein
MSGSTVSQRDFRQLVPTTQAELRRVAVGMVRAGKTRQAPAKVRAFFQAREVRYAA